MASAPGTPAIAPDAGSSRAVVVAIALMVLAGLCSSLMHIGVRYVSAGLPAVEIVFLRSLFTIVVTAPFVFRPGRMSWRTNNWTLQITRGIVGVVSMSTWYWALSVIPLADAGALSFTTAIFVTIGAALYFREKVGIRRWSAVLVGLTGALIVMRPGSGVISLGALIAVASSVLWAVSLLMAKQLSKIDSTMTITFLQPVMIAPLALLASIPVWVWPEWWALGVLFVMGLLGAIGNYGYVTALKLADASLCMPADYIRLVWMASWGYFIFGEVPDMATWLGAALIIAAPIRSLTLFSGWKNSHFANTVAWSPGTILLIWIMGVSPIAWAALAKDFPRAIVLVPSCGGLSVRVAKYGITKDESRSTQRRSTSRTRLESAQSRGNDL